jgi:2-hydroxy-6-oxonona-2,4-dienedioate hydrolase
MPAMHDETGRALIDAYIAARATMRAPRSTGRPAGFTAVHSPGERPLTVVLLPALFVGDWLWDPLAESLAAAGWPTIRFREAASLVDPRTVRSVGRLSTTLLRACREHTTGPLVVCGDSLGAVVAVEIARAYPDDVVGLTISGAPGLDHTAAKVGREIVAGARDSRDIADRFLARLLFQPQRLGIDPERYASVVDDLITPDSAASMLAGLQAIRRYDVRGLLPTLRMPKLLIWGEQDQVTPVEPWRAMIKELTSAQLVVFDECGHAPMFEHPDAYFQELSCLLAECAGEADPP